MSPIANPRHTDNIGERAMQNFRSVDWVTGLSLHIFSPLQQRPGPSRSATGAPG